MGTAVSVAAIDFFLRETTDFMTQSQADSQGKASSPQRQSSCQRHGAPEEDVNVDKDRKRTEKWTRIHQCKSLVIA